MTPNDELRWLAEAFRDAEEKFKGNILKGHYSEWRMANANFHRAVFNPARILALLDEVERLRGALLTTRGLVCEGAIEGFNPEAGDWAERLYVNNGYISRALKGPTHDQ